MAAIPDPRMFPAVPELRASWAPVFVEPMEGSGERITIAVVAVDGLGAFYVHPTLSLRAMNCMYGQAATVFEGVVELAIEVLQGHLATGGSLADWLPPFRTCHLGAVRKAVGSDLEHVALSGVALTSSLFGSEMAEAAKRSGDTGEVGPDVDRWLQQIRDRVRAQTPHLDARFNGEVVVKPGATPTRIGYLGERIAANFDMLVPGPNLSNKRFRAKSRLVDLQILKDQKDMFARRNAYELMLWIPEKDSPGYSQRQLDTAHSALSEIEAFADEHELRVRPFHRADEAAQRILEAEVV